MLSSSPDLGRIEGSAGGRLASQQQKVHREHLQRRSPPAFVYHHVTRRRGTLRVFPKGGGAVV